MWTFIFFILLIVYLSYRWYVGKYDFFEVRGLAGPKPKFPSGNVPSFWNQKRNMIYDIDDIYQEFRNKASFVGYFENRVPNLLLIDPMVVREVMITSFSNFHDNGFGKLVDKESDPIFGRNPFMLSGDEWKEKRAEITPGFTNNRIRALFPLVEEVLDRFTKYINTESKKSNEPFDVREVCAKLTTDVVSSCIFNADAQSFMKEKPEIREMGRKLMDLFDNPLLMIHFFIVSVIPSFSKIKKMQFVRKNVQDFFIDLMHQAVEQREKDKIDRDDYLAFLISLRNKKNLSDLDLAAHGITFFVDGFETSSVAICSTLYELANNKKAQEKLRKQINEQLIDENGKIIYEKMLDHEYLNQVFFEALRLHPPVAFTLRECNEEIILKGSYGENFRVEKGRGLVIPIYCIHRDPANYKDPEEFIPERFDPENGSVKAFEDRSVLIPFGDGPRICLGKRFALMQSKAAIVEAVRNFEMSVNDKTQRPLVIDPKAVVNVKLGGLWLDFKSIK